jgi:hypothetical protein
MLRLTWAAAGPSPVLLSDDEFIREFEPLAERDFAGAPAGTLIVEGLDAQQRVCWSAHYKSVHGVVALLRQLREERQLAR